MLHLGKRSRDATAGAAGAVRSKIGPIVYLLAPPAFREQRPDCAMPPTTAPTPLLPWRNRTPRPPPLAPGHGVCFNTPLSTRDLFSKQASCSTFIFCILTLDFGRCSSCNSSNVKALFPMVFASANDLNIRSSTTQRSIEV